MGFPCRACNRPIELVPTKSGKSIPCDPDRVSIVLDDGEVVSGRVCHFATCTQPDRFRKPRDGESEPARASKPASAPPTATAELAEDMRLVKRVDEFAQDLRPHEVTFVADMVKRVLEQRRAMTPRQREWAKKLDEERVR